MTVYMKQNDTAPALEAVLKDASTGLPIDLSGASVVFRMSRRGSSALKVNAAAELVDAEAGSVRYDWITGDTNRTGTYEGEFVVTFADATRLTVPSTGTIPIQISAGV